MSQHQLFNSSEKRLARSLLLLARYGKQDKPERVQVYDEISRRRENAILGTLDVVDPESGVRYKVLARSRRLH